MCNVFAHKSMFQADVFQKKRLFLGGGGDVPIFLSFVAVNFFCGRVCETFVDTFGFPQYLHANSWTVPLNTSPDILCLPITYDAVMSLVLVLDWTVRS
jgi:hypothetical protein